MERIFDVWLAIKMDCHRHLGPGKMLIRLLSRPAVVLVVAALSACSSTKPPAPSTATGAAAAEERVVADNCKILRSRCIFEGSYDAGERNYAELEAKRLNKAELDRLRRMAQ
ncbi:hypothetical protein [Achromobacter piechaudii]|uniref:hypothetical protein n=1 Tax=Achromobacter piechaudii TaxID=72556 RepID=UPI002ADE106D|nr:hypothetical protein [Achromobacter piechaudii]